MFRAVLNVIKQITEVLHSDAPQGKTKATKPKAKRRAAAVRNPPSRTSSRGGVSVCYAESGPQVDDEEDESDQEEDDAQMDTAADGELQSMLIDLLASMQSMLKVFPLRNHADLVGQTVESMVHGMQNVVGMHSSFRGVAMGE